jgi:hypothetical protein
MAEVISRISPEEHVSIREFVERIMDERDRLYIDKFKASEQAVLTALVAQEKAVNAALAAQEKQTASSFMASEKAIVKAEDAQREYNVRSNEFRGQLDDQAKTLMPRPESLTMFRATEDKLAAVKGELERNIESLRTGIEKNADAIAKELSGLRESRSQSAGKMEGVSSSWLVLIGIVALIGGLLTIGTFIFITSRQQPQYIYAPATPGTMIPTQPTAVPK